MRFFPSFHATEIFISKWLEMSRVCIAYLYGAITKHIFLLEQRVCVVQVNGMQTKWNEW